MLERTDIPNERVENTYISAYNQGYKVSRFYGDFLYFLIEKHCQGGRFTLRVWKDLICIYSNDKNKAITVYKIPQEYLPIDKYLINDIHDKKRCYIRVGEERYASHNGLVDSVLNATIFTSVAKASAYLSNNYAIIDNEKVEIVEIKM